VNASEFTRRVVAVIRRIPPGRIASYGTIAELAGRPRAARAVGNILRDTRVTGLPAHRVVAAHGALGGFGGNLPLKRALLAGEGIQVRRNRIVDWRTRTWPRPETSSRTPKRGTRGPRSAREE
jgi:methylated-DNA-[protein]-cysteine S-methyltransferase